MAKKSNGAIEFGMWFGIGAIVLLFAPRLAQAGAALKAAAGGGGAAPATPSNTQKPPASGSGSSGGGISGGGAGGGGIPTAGGGGGANRYTIPQADMKLEAPERIPTANSYADSYLPYEAGPYLPGEGVPGSPDYMPESMPGVDSFDWMFGPPEIPEMGENYLPESLPGVDSFDWMFGPDPQLPELGGYYDPKEPTDFGPYRDFNPYGEYSSVDDAFGEYSYAGEPDYGSYDDYYDGGFDDGGGWY